MPTPQLPSGDGFSDFTILDLDEHGDFLDPATRQPVPHDALPAFLDRSLSLPCEVTDIVLFVHGWNNSPGNAVASAARLFNCIELALDERAGRYPELAGYCGYYTAVRWPSQSKPLPAGYRRIRDRAHAMTTHGHAEYVLSALLGYLNLTREQPRVGPPTLRTRSGQYLHLVGHSFGGRFLAEAVKEAANPQGPPVLPLPPPNPRYPYTVDNMLIFQMAAHPDAFTHDLAPVLDKAPVHGPVTLTFSDADRANCLWHRIIENTPGIGCCGATSPPARTVKLRPINHDYDPDELAHPLINMDASWLYQRGRALPQGAHSDFWYPESIHLLLALAAHARSRP
jgi:esterase/lipase superfamily enzyme